MLAIPNSHFNLEPNALKAVFGDSVTCAADAVNLRLKADIPCTCNNDKSWLKYWRD